MPRRRASVTTMRLAVAESRVRWVGFRSATRTAISASKAAVARSMSFRPAAVRVTCTLRRSSVEAVRWTSPRSWARSTRPVTLDLSSWRKLASSLMVGRRSRRIPSSRAWTIDRSWAAAIRPERPLHGKGQLGQRVHQAQVSLAGQRGEDRVAACRRHTHRV